MFFSCYIDTMEKQETNKTIKVLKDVSYNGDIEGHIVDITHDNNNDLIAGVDRNTNARVELSIFDNEEILNKRIGEDK